MRWPGRPALAARLFAESERERPLRSLAGYFAAKEALAKALGAPPGLRWTDAVVWHDARGRPLLEVSGTVAAAAARSGVTALALSISHDAGLCVAMVVARADGSARRRARAVRERTRWRPCARPSTR